jgi:chemotaxis protein CheD
MCHFVHVNGNRAQRPGQTVYAEAALLQMYRLLEEQGISPRLCVAFVYGGGNMFPSLVTQPHVGQANARWALEMLEGEGIPVIRQQTCGTVYRRVAWSIGPTDPTVCEVPV